MRLIRHACEKNKRRGIALVAAMIFVIVFMAMSVGMVSMSSQNVISAANLQTGNLARSTAESGLEVVRYWLSQTDVESDSQEALFAQLADALKSSVANITITDILDNDGNLTGLHIPGVALQSNQSGVLQSFDAEIRYDSAAQHINVSVIGQSGILSRKLKVDYAMPPETTQSETAPELPPLSPLFGYGVASKGPISMTGNTLVTGYNQASEGSIFVEALNSSQTFYIDGSCRISGNVSIANPNHTTVQLGGNPWIDGSAVQPWWPFNPNNFTEQEINDRGVYVNTTGVEFPRPNPQQFRQYATGPEITSSMSSVYTLDNAVIKAGTNPTFTGVYEIRGVLYIEQPNKVTFGGSCTISAIIVAEGDHENADPANNKLTWSGHVTNNNVQSLPDETQFAQIRQLEGVSVLAPGFELNIGATYNAYERFHGSIVGNGINFTGDPTLVINGTVINYSDTPMTLGGSSKLYFDNKDIDSWPVGLLPDGFEDLQGQTIENTIYRIQYRPASYEEIRPCQAQH